MSVYPDVSAKAFCVARLYGLNSEHSGQYSILWNHSHDVFNNYAPASLTKMATLAYILKFAQLNEESMLLEKVKISKEASETRGTTAELEEGDEVIVKDLLSGMMLPSGNDAATALAEHFGSKEQLKSMDSSPNPTPMIDPETLYREHWTTDHPIGRFMKELNSFTKEIIGCRQTSFSNPHGLGHPHNYSSCNDMLKIACFGVTSCPGFRDIVSQTSFECTKTTKDGKVKKVRWRNTNKLLGRQRDMIFHGIKTGWIPINRRVHGCLASLFQVKSDDSKTTDEARILEEDSYVIITMGSTNRMLRFIDTQKIAEWVVESMNTSDDEVSY
eukprot:TRINITY_DN23001_c0_g1_i1.p1 TRINITY_DN23001_c0_g1~~TRINITY_DN23001_c0_g1_i1.p1  ORF type:complete len:329 (+),score=60.59 TRINITY_DN23001_c0_g1_i1:137-1123(+)